MKKYIIVVCALFSLGRLLAQELVESDSITATTYHQKSYLPKSGDIAIGVNVIPLVEFLGNSFNGYGTNGARNTIGSMGGSVINLDFAPKPDVSIMLKYFTSDKTAIRLNVGFLTNLSNEQAYVASDKLKVTDPLSDHNLIDRISTQTSGGCMTAGYEFRVGKNRIQGIFGADLLFAYQIQNTKYEYGNELTTLNNKPTASTLMPKFDASGYRATELKSGNYIYSGGILSAGIECFISPKIAFGTEVNLMAYYKKGSSSYEIREGLNSYTNELEKRTVLQSPGNNGFVIGTGNFTSKLYLIFYL